MSEPLHHSRAMPPAWPALSERAETLLPSTRAGTYADSVTADNMLTLYNETHSLDSTSLEANHYYGLGRVMCHMGSRLEDPETRQQLIENGIGSVLQVEGSMTPGHRIANIGSYRFLSPFHRFTLDALQQLSPAERLLTETLTLATSHRRSDIKRSDEQLRWAVDREVSRHEDSIATTRINVNFLNGAAIALRKVLKARGGPDLPSDALVTDVMTYEELRALKIRKFATNCARLRVDEIRKVARTPLDEDQIVHVDANGELYVDLEYLRSEPPEIERDGPGDAPVSRKERLECPALQAKLIPIVLPMLIEITIGADQRIKQRNEQIRNRLAGYTSS